VSEKEGSLPAPTGADEEGVLVRINAVAKSIVDSVIATHRGRMVKTSGDGMLVEIAGAVDAMRRGQADCASCLRRVPESLTKS